MSLKQSVNSFIGNAKQYWKTPPKGYYVPYREIMNLGVAGIGVHWTSNLASTIGLNVGNFLVGASIGLKAVDLQTMLVIANILGMPLGIFRAWHFDNAKFKGGKFLPFLRYTTIPIVLLSTIFVYLPYENWSYTTKVVVVWFMYFLLQFFLSYYNESYQSVQQIISPNAQERANVLSISQIIFSFAPTITTIIIPTVAGFTFGLDNIWTYRTIYPVFSVLGLIINLIFLKRVKERIILPKKKAEAVRFWDSIREVSKNKYFWILRGATWIGFLESAYGMLLGWTFVYANSGKYESYYGLAQTVIGNAALWAMILTPFAIRKFGKRNLLIICNIFNIVAFIIMFFVYKNVILLCVVLYFNGFVSTFYNIYYPSMDADMRDYHQWKTGVRIDGMFAPLGLIGTVIGFFTGYVVPYICEMMGLKEDYTVLYDDAIRNNLSSVLIICSVIGAILNVIPYFFYDLTEVKHAGYIKVLKIRAMFSDFGDGVLSEEDLVQGMEIINTAKELQGKEKKVLNKASIRQAKKTGGKSAAQQAKAQYKADERYNEEVELAPLVIQELNKFSTRRYIEQLARAERIINSDPTRFAQKGSEELVAAKALPKSSEEEKQIRADAISFAKELISAGKLISANGVPEKPDESEKLEIENRQTNSLAESYKAKKDMKNYLKKVSLYQRATKPHTKAQELISQAENYLRAQEIEQLYYQNKNN